MAKATQYTQNGAHIALYPMPSVESVAVNITVRAGSWYEAGVHWGAFHFMEHMSFDGSARFKNPISYNFFRERHGIYANVYTDVDSMGYSLTFPRTKLSEGFTFARELVFGPTFPDRQLQREAEVVSQEYTGMYSNPHQRFARNIRERLFGQKLYETQGFDGLRLSAWGGWRHDERLVLLRESLLP